MSFTSDIKQSVRDQLIELSEDIKDRNSSECISERERYLSNDALAKAVLPVVDLNERRAERLEAERYNKLVDDLARIVAEAIAYEELKEHKCLRNIPRELEEDLLRSMDKFNGMCQDWQDSDNYSGGSRRDRHHRRDDEEERGLSRRERRLSRSRGNQDQRKAGRHVNSYERDNEPNSRHIERDDYPESNEVEIVKQPQLQSGVEVDKHNYALLPEVCKDVPLFFAGLENIIYLDEPPRVVVNLLEGKYQMNYDKHRTDTYLAKNRDAITPDLAIDKLDKQMKQAALNKVNAYASKEAKNEDDDGLEGTINQIKITNPCVVNGVYNVNFGILQSEIAVREILEDALGNKFNQLAVATTFSHLIFKADETIQQVKNWEELRTITENLAVEARLNDVKALLEYTQQLFTPQSYNDLYTIVNAAVCNALSCSLKLGIRTQSILSNWDDIEKLIQSQYLEKPHIIGLINTNLAAALPSVMINDEGEVRVLRNYIFLPISKNEFSVASPIRYATLNKSDRPDLYNFVQKTLTTNIPPETYKALTTLVTLENESLTVCTNRNLISDNGFYIFQPI